MKATKRLPRILNAMRTLAHHVDASVIQSRIVASGLSEQDAILYAYWGDANALALALHAPQKFTVRFHRGDLYHDRKRGGQPSTQHRIVSEAAHVIAISGHGQHYLRRLYPDCREKIDCLYLGVPRQSTPTPTTAAPFTFASISYAVPVKRLDLLVDTLRTLIQRGEHARWIHIGDGPELPRVARRIAELALTNHVAFVGHLPQAEEGLYPFLRTTPIDVVINTSESEGLPVSLMEAISFSIPVIATNVGGTSELVIPSGGTLLPPNPSADIIADALTTHIRLQTPEVARRRDLSKQAHEVLFNSERNARALWQIWSQDSSQSKGAQ